jgi:hypothetical protein
MTAVAVVTRLCSHCLAPADGTYLVGAWPTSLCSSCADRMRARGISTTPVDPAEAASPEVAHSTGSAAAAVALTKAGRPATG